MLAINSANVVLTAILQEIGEKCRSLQREIFHGKKEVRRKICEKHVSSIFFII